MTKLRPGSKEAGIFFRSETSPETWSDLLNKYDDAIHLVSNSKKKPQLLTLDKFWRQEFPSLVRSRSPHHMLQEELSKIMAWKLSRGQFRPLHNRCDSNGDPAVKAASQKAFEYMNKSNPDWKAAMQSLTSLNAVGEATASAVLAPLYPNQCPFMADEALDVTCGKRNYDAKTYLTMHTCLTEKAKELGSDFTPEDVGRALWVKAILVTNQTTKPEESGSNGPHDNTNTSSSKANDRSLKNTRGRKAAHDYPKDLHAPQKRTRRK